MTELHYDALVIGGGAAGMAAALELSGRGASVAIVEREEGLGGILTQCIHNGFGLVEYDEELTGPEFAARLEARVAASPIATFVGATVLSLEVEGPTKTLIASSARRGLLRLSARAVVLAMGCRERNRGNIRIPGTRPAGIYTAGLAQRLVNIEGYVPGREAVIIGSGDIGLIMARRLSWIGCKVKAVVEILPFPSGLPRNIVQCLRDFDIPLHLAHLTTAIYGRDRVEGIEVTPLIGGAPAPERAFRIDCDTLLLSVGLVPENELSRRAGIELNPATGGPLVDSRMMTSAEGVFASGNVLHVHDLVDYVVEESRRAGGFAADWLSGLKPERELRLKAGSNLRYVSPSRVDPDRDNRVYLRSFVAKNEAVLEVRLGGRSLRSLKKGHVQPSEMISLNLSSRELKAGLAELAPGAVAELEIALT